MPNKNEPNHGPAGLKAFTVPFWWIGAIIALLLIPCVSLWIGYQRISALPQEDYLENLRKIYIRQLVMLGLLLVILIAEAITYWKIRRLIGRRSLVWTHLVTLLLAFIMIPLVITLYNAWLSKTYTPSQYSAKILFVATIRLSLMIVLLTFGHICFILVLKDAAKKRKQLKQPPEQAGDDILNDYAEEH